jgi:hypothetical protein
MSTAETTTQKRERLQAALELPFMLPSDRARSFVYDLDTSVIEALTPERHNKGLLQRITLDYLRRHKLLNEEIPTDERFLFYELEQKGAKRKKAAHEGGRKSTQDLTDAVTHLRNIGAIPWEWIVDNSRQFYEWEYDDSIADCLARAVNGARLDRWAGTVRPVIITESKGVAGVLERGVARQYLTAVTGVGNCHGFLITRVARALADENTRVLYVGDYDGRGHDIENHIQRVLERATGRTFDNDTWERVALTKDQTDDLRARGVEPIMKVDNRRRDKRPYEAYEAEALGQRPIENLVRAKLEELIPESLDSVRVREETEREEIRHRLGLNGSAPQ